MMSMKLLSVNVGTVQPLYTGEKSGKSGIFKMPSSVPVRIMADGLAGDAVVDKANHGGPDQAVYVYGSVDYDWWSRELGRSLAPGTFGDNLTIEGLESAQLNVGDRLQVGKALLEATAPRIPCVTLATRMGDPAFVKRFRQAERPGLYCRVIEPGAVQAGDPVRLIPFQGETFSLLELFRLFYEKQPGEQALRRVLAAPIAVRSRQENEVLLAALLSKPAD